MNESKFFLYLYLALMITFSNSKINLGLYVLNKRSDGYHDISTVFYPIGWKDIIEIIPDESINNNIEIYNFGLSLNIPLQENIIFKAYQLLLNRFNNLPGLKVYLYKQVPYGAGLGGGSANAAFFLQTCNNLLKLNLTKEELKEIASKLGADCAFFMENKPCIASGKGDVLTPIELDLSSYYIYVVFPGIPISTKEAYQNVVPQNREVDLQRILQLPIEEWKYYLVNDFENSIFNKYPVLSQLKQRMYDYGALYGSMSGSGSAIYGIFKEKPLIEKNLELKYFIEKL
ncbi:MAG: 4-diphosphocytidyl-2-C-methyl-D-erythritol kinase [Bacteroidia bacterium]|nr:MAG: 4-diphosphocytidyl-2-C-methyl-D-erythritol kinase [Bacteroidia bacterium]